MNLQASLRSSILFKMCMMASQSLDELFRSNASTSLYDLSCSLVACCWVTPSSTEYWHEMALSVQILHEGRPPSHCHRLSIFVEWIACMDRQRTNL